MARPFTPLPRPWSDQGDREIMRAGRPGGADEARVVDGSLAVRRVAALHRRGHQVVAARA